jgi:phosphorylcholine metabolism protein LicD
MYKDTWYRMPVNINLSVPMIERENVFLEISDVIKFLNKLESCDYFFSCGTALGLVREGKLLDWDTDVDIDIIEPTELIIESIINQMKKLDYSFQRVLKRNGRYSQIVFFKEPYHSIDFCFWYKNNNNLINDVPETYVFKRTHPLKIYNKFKEIKIKNIDFKIPYDTDSYFKLLYGEDWQTPKKYKLWLRNAHDLKIDFNILNIFFKILWRFKLIRKTI